jgi:hypothetical protein
MDVVDESEVTGRTDGLPLTRRICCYDVGKWAGF